MDLCEVSDEALEAEIERRKRRREMMNRTAAVREMVHAIVKDSQHPANQALRDMLRSSLGNSDFDLFLDSPHRFEIQIVGSYLPNS